MNASPPAARLSRPWLDLRWIMAGVVTLAIGALLWGLFGPEPRIIVSRETTCITEPLAQDVLPDYRTHLLSLYGPAPPPEDNAAAVLLQVLWPLEMTSPSAELTAVCRALAMPDTPPDDRPLVAPMQDAVVKAAVEKSAIGSIEKTQAMPWKSSDLPELAAWVENHSPALDRLLEASQRPRYWFPSPTLLMPKEQPLIGVTLPDIQSFRRAGGALASRAMWHLGAGRTREAWADILGIHRLSRLLAPARDRPAFIVTHMIAISVAGQAGQATRQLLSMPGLRDDERAIIHRDLAALAPLGTIREPLRAERLAGIDLAVWLSSARLPGSRRRRFMECLDLSSGGFPSQFVLFTSLDWNLVLKRLNAAYDEIDAAACLPTAAQREAALKRLDGGRGSALPSGGWLAAAGRLLNLLVSRSTRSDQAADTIQAMFMPALSNHAARVTRAHADFEALLTEAAGPAP